MTNNDKQIFQSKFAHLKTDNYNDLERQARKLHQQIVARTKRNPYVKSKYFANQKIFVNLFWNHLNEKHRIERKRRLVFYKCAIDLLRNSTKAPDSKINPKNPREVLHRFYGKSSDGMHFAVQVRESLRNDNKFFMSVFPWRNQK
jgi:hypothetical protein